MEDLSRLKIESERTGTSVEELVRIEAEEREKEKIERERLAAEEVHFIPQKHDIFLSFDGKK